MSEEGLPEGDPRILESPLEACLELASLTARMLPGVRRRSRLLLLFAAVLTASLLCLISTAALPLLSAGAGLRLPQMLSLVYIGSLIALLVPSVGLALVLIVMAYREGQLLALLESTSRALAALQSGGRVDNRSDPGRGAGGARADALEGILGSALWAGRLVPAAERMVTVARAVLALVLLALMCSTLFALAALLLGLAPPVLLLTQTFLPAALAPLVGLLLRGLKRDLDFYRYYARRQRAVSEVAALGPPGVPEGRDALERYELFLRSSPGPCGPCESTGLSSEEVSCGADLPPSRLYMWRSGASKRGALVTVFDRVPRREELEQLLQEARGIRSERGVVVERAVALLSTGAGEVSDDLYDYIIELGERTPRGAPALQLVIEVEGAYSMVPYIASE